MEQEPTLNKLNLKTFFSYFLLLIKMKVKTFLYFYVNTPPPPLSSKFKLENLFIRYFVIFSRVRANLIYGIYIIYILLYTRARVNAEWFFVFSRPARHKLRLCFVRPLNTDIDFASYSQPTRHHYAVLRVTFCCRRSRCCNEWLYIHCNIAESVSFQHVVQCALCLFKELEILHCGLHLFRVA